MKRRYFLVGTVLLAGAFAWWKKPRDAGAPYDGYFSLLNQELKKNGPMRPCMVIDLDRMDQNIDRVRHTLKLAGKKYRIVEKSLPSQKLIEYIAQRAQTRRLMSFHQPFLNLDAEIFSGFDILMGKPLPVRSAELFYRHLKGPFDPTRQLQWLIDSPQRLQEYLQLAQGLNTKLRTNIEIDVGLHRGGGGRNPSSKRHALEKLSTEISTGTALLKPTHYDLEPLAEHVPAAFIATPVIKSTGPIRIPALDDKSKIFSWWDPNQRATFFVYGGWRRGGGEAAKRPPVNPNYTASPNAAISYRSPAGCAPGGGRAH